MQLAAEADAKLALDTGADSKVGTPRERTGSRVGSANAKVS